jgi:hypothetical protein
VKLLAINAHAPLASWRAHPGAQLKLYCGACAWSRTYDPARIAERLAVRRLGSAMTPVSAIAGHVQWPCPGCGRMRWASVLVAP